jgi:membrane protein
MKTRILWGKYFWVAYQKFMLDNGALYTASLTFHTLFAIAPFFAILFGMARGFGLESTLQDLLTNVFEGQQQVQQQLSEFAVNLLQKTQQEIVAGVGIVILVWSILKVLRELDGLLRKVWLSHNYKKIIYRLPNLLAFIFFIPILLMIAWSFLNYMSSSISPYVAQISDVTAIKSYVMLKMLSMIGVGLMLGSGFYMLAEKPIAIRPCIVAGLATSMLFHALQAFYIHSQYFIASYGIVYGSFAAIPLFMLWIYLNWFVFIFGVELCFVLEHKIKHSWQLQVAEISDKTLYQLSETIMLKIGENFAQQKPAFNAKQLAHTLNLPLLATKFILSKLVDAQLILPVPFPESKSITYHPIKPLQWLTKVNIYTAINNFSNSPKLDQQLCPRA